MQSGHFLPSTLEEFHNIAVVYNKDIAVNLAFEYPNVAKLITFNYFQMIAELESEYALKLADLPQMEELIDSKKKWIQICNASFEIAITLLKHPNIARIAEPIKAFMPYYYLNQNTPRNTQKKLATESFAALDLAELKIKDIANIEDKQWTDLESAGDLEAFDRKKAFRVLLRTFPTVKKYYDLMMYGPSGYYATGKVDFKNHYITFASVPAEVIGFSAAMAYQLFHIRKKLIVEGKLKTSDQFNVLECGGGNGDLCFNILTTISNMAKYSQEWKQLLSVIHYHLVDISPELVKRQKERNRQFAEKVEVLQGSALQEIEGLTDKKMAVILSNELLDMFAPQEVCFNEEGNLVVGTMIPFIYQYSYHPYFKYALEKAGLSLDQLLVDSNKYKALFIVLCPKNIQEDLETELKDSLFLTEQSFLKLHKVTAQEKNCPNLFNFIKSRIIDADCDNELAEFLKRNPTYTDRMKDGLTMRYADVGIHEYLKTMNNFLMSGGEIITVDYGNNDFLVSEYLRTFSEGREMGVEIRSEPGFKDITKFVNFSTLAREGEELNFNTKFYGLQSQLNIDDYPAAVLSPMASMFYKARCAQSDNFRVMVQEKQEEGEEKKVTSDSTARFVGESLAVSHAQLFNNLKQKVKQQKVKSNVKQTQNQQPSNPKETSNYQSTVPLFQSNQGTIDYLVKKYNLADSTQPSLEKGLRNAASKNQADDLRLFISVVKNIDAKDNDPDFGRTALHWAALKGCDECYHLLLKAGANPNTPDANGETANDHLLLSTLNEFKRGQVSP